MAEKTLISVVTPVYNGAQYIQGAYESLRRQTYPHWEWVVVDDGSTDDTRVLLRALADTDHRIKYTRQSNTGSAKQPRDRAVFQGRGELVLVLDIDDLLTDDYLQLMLARMQETNADIVYPQMVFIDKETKQETCTLPVADFDISRVYEGRQLVRETVPEWRIGCNGGLYRRQVWVNMSWLEEHEPIWVYSDEVDERLFLLKAQRVAFSRARYFYLLHPASITRRSSTRQFQELQTNNQLLALMEKTFGKDSEEYRRARQKAVKGWSEKAMNYLKNHRQMFSADWLVQQELAAAFAVLYPGRSYLLRMSLMALRYSPLWLVEKVAQRYWPETYQWRVVRRLSHQHIAEQVSVNYSETSAVNPCQPYAVFMSGENTPGGGLVDRLRGAVSVYAAASQTGRAFRIFFTHPFPLADYLEPNSYDWRITKDELSLAPSQTRIVISDSQTGAHWERRQQEQMMVEAMKGSADRQLHFYTNALFCYDLDFRQLFHELFKPSDRLSAHIEKVKSSIGGDYIAVSARFMHLLGDFNEAVESEELGVAEKDLLLQNCLKALASLHRKYEDKRIVVCSDSITFLQLAQKEDYVYTIPGIISHIANDQKRSYSYYEKTFLDFFVISDAVKVFLLKADRMHNSGFPYAAALMGGRPYEIIECQ